MKEDADTALPRGTYRHYKRGLYEVIGVAYHSESLEKHVVYKALYEQEPPSAFCLGTINGPHLSDKKVLHS